MPPSASRFSSAADRYRDASGGASADRAIIPKRTRWPSRPLNELSKGTELVGPKRMGQSFGDSAMLPRSRLPLHAPANLRSRSPFASAPATFARRAGQRRASGAVTVAAPFGLYDSRPGVGLRSSRRLRGSFWALVKEPTQPQTGGNKTWQTEIDRFTRFGTAQ